MYIILYFLEKIKNFISWKIKNNPKIKKSWDYNQPTASSSAGFL
jgi:hypothetical protein